MQLFTVICVFVVTTVACMHGSAALQYSKNGKTSGRRCQRLPRPMTLDAFRDEVENQGFTELLFTVSFPITEADLGYHFNMKLDETSTAGTFTQDVVARGLDDTGNGSCATGTRTLTAVSPRSAVFDRAGSDFDYYYFSRNTSNYLFEFGCNQTRRLGSRRCCSGDWLLSLYANDDPPHFFDWEGASRELWKRLRVCLTNIFYFTNRLNACTNAAP